MRLQELVQTSERVAAAPGRLDKVRHLAALLAHVERREAGIAVAYLSGELPQGRIGIGPATLEAAADVTPASDSGLTLAEVDQRLTRLAAIAGPGSTSARLRQLRSLLAEATLEEQRFLDRLLLGELRQGAQEGVMLEAVARAAEVPVGRVRRAVMLTGDAHEVARTLLREGPGALEEFTVRLFRPLQPMLAQTVEGVEEALGFLGRAAFEHKLDGVRVQAHKRGEEVRVFTRRLNDETGSLPEIVEAVRALPARELVLDGEAIGLRADGRPRPFQETATRLGRVRDVDRLRRAVPLSAFFFDCLLLDGEPLIDRPAEDRFQLLVAAVPAVLRVPRLVTGDPAEAARFLEAAIGAGQEGLVAKALDAPYAAGRRGRAWLKLKPVHTVDLVVLAAEWGSGRRQGWLSNLHLGARDPATGELVMVGKTFKGLTDQLLSWQTARLLELERERRGRTVYVRPELVVEVAFDGVQRSPRYESGLALRFARVRRYREDKRPDEADSTDMLRRLRDGKRPAIMAGGENDTAHGGGETRGDA